MGSQHQIGLVEMRYSCVHNIILIICRYIKEYILINFKADIGNFICEKVPPKLVILRVFVFTDYSVLTTVYMCNINTLKI